MLKSEKLSFPAYHFIVVGMKFQIFYLLEIVQNVQIYSQSYLFKPSTSMVWDGGSVVKDEIFV